MHNFKYECLKFYSNFIKIYLYEPNSQQVNIGSGNVGGIDQYNIPKPTFTQFSQTHVDGLVQERRNSIAKALELRLSCTNPSICMHH